MGSGCVCQNSNSGSGFSRLRTVRVGNFSFMIHENKTTAKGCKRTPAWETLATREEVAKKIEEFWDTRVEGNPEVWKVLRAACRETAPGTAEQIIKAAGISILSGSLMLTFDDVGYRYDLPVYVINEAIKYGVEKTLQRLPESFRGEDIEIFLRCSKYSDEKMSVNTGQTIREVKSGYAEKLGLIAEKIRVFFNGKELKNEMNLHHCNVKNDYVLQVHVA